MAKSKSTADRLEEIRQQVAELETERENLDRHPVPRDHALAALDRWIAKQAEQFEAETGVNGLLRGEASASLSVVTFANGARSWTPTLCAIVPDAVRQHFTQRIDRALEGQTPMSPEDRKRRAEEIDREVYRLNVEEERIIQDMHANGEGVTRRRDADPRAILGLTEPPKAPASPPTEKPQPWRYRDTGGRQVTHHRLPRES